MENAIVRLSVTAIVITTEGAEKQPLLQQPSHNKLLLTPMAGALGAGACQRGSEALRCPRIAQQH